MSSDRHWGKEAKTEAWYISDPRLGVPRYVDWGSGIEIGTLNAALAGGEPDFMSDLFPITESDLARARLDPAFRQKLLALRLDALLASMKRLRGTAVALSETNTKQLREGVELAVRLAEIIQGAAKRSSNP